MQKPLQLRISAEAVVLLKFNSLIHPHHYEGDTCLITQDHLYNLLKHSTTRILKTYIINITVIKAVLI